MYTICSLFAICSFRSKGYWPVRPVPEQGSGALFRSLSPAGSRHPAGVLALSTPSHPKERANRSEPIRSLPRPPGVGPREFAALNFLRVPGLALVATMVPTHAERRSSVAALAPALRG